MEKLLYMMNYVNKHVVLSLKGRDDKGFFYILNKNFYIQLNKKIVFLLIFYFFQLNMCLISTTYCKSVVVTTIC